MPGDPLRDRLPAGDLAGTQGAATERGRCYSGVLPLEMCRASGFSPAASARQRGKTRGPRVKSATARWNPQPPRAPRYKSDPPQESSRNPQPSQATTQDSAPARPGSLHPAPGYGILVNGGRRLPPTTAPSTSPTSDDRTALADTSRRPSNLTIHQAIVRRERPKTTPDGQLAQQHFLPTRDPSRRSRRRG